MQFCEDKCFEAYYWPDWWDQNRPLTNRRVSYSWELRMSACFCAKVRLMQVTSHQVDKQTWKNNGWFAEKRKMCNVHRCWRSQNLLTGLRNHCFQELKENQLIVTKKNNEHNQKLSKSSVSEFDKNAKMVSKSLDKVVPWSHFNSIFSDG